MAGWFSTLTKHKAFPSSVVLVVSLVGFFIALYPPSVEKEYDRLTRGRITEYGPFDLSGATYRLHMKAPELRAFLRRNDESYAAFSVSLWQEGGEEVWRDTIRLSLEHETRRTTTSGAARSLFRMWDLVLALHRMAAELLSHRR